MINIGALEYNDAGDDWNDGNDNTNNDKFD